MNHPHKQSDYEYMMDVVKGAGKLLMGCLGKPEIVIYGEGEKERSGYTTTADVISLSHIITGIIDEFPEDGIIAEGLDEKKIAETKLKELLDFDFPIEDNMYKGENGFYWVIDPLCGTIMHERGIPDFVVSLALVDETADVYFGCVYDPWNREMFFAKKGGKAYLSDEKSTKQIKVSDIKGKDLKDKALVSIEHGLVRSEDEIKLLSAGIKRQRTAGTCGLELSYVGAGKLDAALKRRQPLYDYAGGIIIVERAGGLITDFEGKNITKRLSYDKCTDFVASNGKIHQQILKYTKMFREKKAA